MTNDIEIIIKDNYGKMLKAIKLVIASLDRIKPFDIEKHYSPEEMEPYDALSDRFVRAVESIKFFRTYEKFLFGDNTDTIRDLLNRMEKAKVISSISIWFGMRDVRNRIVHDYLPVQIKTIYDTISNEYGDELRQLSTKDFELS